MAPRRERKKSQGRQKIEMKLIADENARTVTFSKRRVGLFKKANELSILCGAQIALIIFSLGGRAYSFGHPDVESVLRRFYSRNRTANVQDSSSVEGRRMGGAMLQELKDECDQKNAEVEARKKRAREIEAQLEASNCDITEERLDRMSLEQLRELKEKMENLREYLRRRAHHGDAAVAAGPSNAVTAAAADDDDDPREVDLANVEKDDRDAHPIPPDWLKL